MDSQNFSGQNSNMMIGKIDRPKSRRVSDSSRSPTIIEEKEIVYGAEVDTKPYDIVIFGASGSVGKFLVEELALVEDKYYPNDSFDLSSKNNGSNNIRDLKESLQIALSQRRISVPRHMDEGIKWAIAGRSAMRLNETLCKAELSTGINNLSNKIEIILADLNHHRSLIEMCSKTKLLINCAGPYSLDGEALIKACLETKTHYIDLAHETTFIELIQSKYSDEAREKEVYIINGCGFQAMSAEMGLNFVKNVVDGQIDEVKIVLNLSDSKASIKVGSGIKKEVGIIPWGMWRSLLSEKTLETSLKDRLQKQSKKQGLELSAAHTSSSDEGHSESISKDTNRRHYFQRYDTQSLIKNMMELKSRKSFGFVQLFKGFDDCSRRYCLPIDSLTSEESQLIRGEMDNYELRRPDLNNEVGWKPIRSNSFITMKTLADTIWLLFWLIIFNLLTKLSIFRKLMQTFPSLSTFGNVRGKRYGIKSDCELDRDSLSHIKFCQTFLVYGTPGDDSGDPLKERVKHSKRPQEQLLVARIVGQEPNHVTTATYAIQAAITLILEIDHLPSTGGVLTPGAAFADTNIIYQLRRRNIKFEVLKKA